MSKLEQQFLEDRALRNAAKALLDADIARVKANLDDKSVGKRALDRAKDGAAEVFEQASIKADTNHGILVVLIGAIVLWFARNPILSLFMEDEELDQLTETNGDASPESITTPEEMLHDD